MSRIAVLGASGYSGEELVRLLIRHPHVEIAALTSRQFAGKSVGEVYPAFAGRGAVAELKFTDAPASSLAALGVTHAFLALPHGLAAEFAVPLLDSGVNVLDLSADFRIKDAAVYEDFYKVAHPAPALLAEAVYGLPEVHAEAIRGARLVACAGCYPTSILLPLVPLVARKLIKPASVSVVSLSGVTGAGRKAELAYLFAECNENARQYGGVKHRHLAEIEQELTLAEGDGAEHVTISFTPILAPLNRGMLTTIYAAPASDAVGIEEIQSAWKESYSGAEFVRLLPEGAAPAVRNVQMSNFADLAALHDKRTGRVVLMSAIDNLGKGAAGQAVQCLNLMLGCEASAGLL